MNYKEFSKKLETICAISLTPFYKDTKEINWSDLEENIRFLIDRGLKVIVPCGNTSEFYSLTLEEAKAEIAKAVEIADKRAVMMPGIGYSVKTAIELGQFAEQAGADCVMIHQPIHPYITEKGAIAYFKEIIEAIGIPSVIYFKDPHLSDNVLVELSSMDKLVGVKYAINDLPRFAKLVREVPEGRNITWICGTAEKWAPFYFNAGAKGFTSGLVNVYPEKSFEMLNALQTLDRGSVWKVWNEVLPFEDLRAKYNNGNNVAVVKEAAAQLGLMASIIREPAAPLDKNDVEQTTEILKGWGLL